ncbi:prolipoprotein diacylglyceryl transferase [Gluconobacter wancherniae]|uniref:Phosphatidylglycerol--prolipoprotein diacylglyceryl transferase n=1 Tax=Gluconobacter wancherniae NBRC 103581 TaxID=656744 RepID=A0A511B1R7_9PROT|nr:prolipoprotein diacylglyceryl transferase [Gluconobacter wancherniae]MBF0854528.1 prolipoprotein diacylglyceryl transferase [Gluconobacter wancherniae]GBD57747.1 prolipoprotein diacylglyceryl transferase [Gluconobacter wancherniae NBRC 103581]GBR62433.1 prolipoprotein diacylglyceryl transferase [Gluconobacter wancherniae NBRC 103581]GEK94395.1 prolipoprotein diacylglyceryl transferase [Gluconobacter wancherniae NBRC 103581]
MFPGFDPVAFHVGPLAVRWYALAYMVSFIIALPIAKRLCRLSPEVATGEQVDDFLFYAILGVLVGGRLGYVLFYRPLDYLSNPLEILKTWDGGMSFHGGALGVIIALALFSWKKKLNFLAFSDRIVPVVPIGLGLGRCANFVNGELWGRAASPDLPWAMVFPTGGPIARHPSELYEALTEGVVLLTVMLFSATRPRLREHFGFLSGLFLFGYACARSFCEFFRQPDANIGFLSGGVTMGQILCIPMAMAGIGLMIYALKNPRRARAHA